MSQTPPRQPETPPAPDTPAPSIPQHLPPKNPGQLEDTPPPAEEAGRPPPG